MLVHQPWLTTTMFQMNRSEPLERRAAVTCQVLTLDHIWRPQLMLVLSTHRTSISADGALSSAEELKHLHDAVRGKIKPKPCRCCYKVPRCFFQGTLAHLHPSMA